MQTASHGVQRFTLYFRAKPETNIVYISNQLHGAGLNDALVGMSGGRLSIDVDREAPSLQEAVTSARNQIHGCGLKLQLIETDPPEAKQYM